MRSAVSMTPFRPREKAVEWYESLFLQMCSHVLTQSKMANRRGLTGALTMDTTSTRDLVESYERNVAVAFSAAEMKDHLSQGANCVVLIIVKEHQFQNYLTDINRQQEVMNTSCVPVCVHPGLVGNTSTRVGDYRYPHFADEETEAHSV